MPREPLEVTSQTDGIWPVADDPFGLQTEIRRTFDNEVVGRPSNPGYTLAELHLMYDQVEEPNANGRSYDRDIQEVARRLALAARQSRDEMARQSFAAGRQSGKSMTNALARILRLQTAKTGKVHEPEKDMEPVNVPIDDITFGIEEVPERI